MAKRRGTKDHVSGPVIPTSSWSGRFRRMRVYNPRATFEQAERINELFEATQRSNGYNPINTCRFSCDQRFDNHQDTRCNILDLVDDVLLIIFKYAADLGNLQEGPSVGQYLFSARTRLACKTFFRLMRVCRRFRSVVYRFHSLFPKPSIGLRIQVPHGHSPIYEEIVVLYIYGDSGKHYFSKCVNINDIPAAIFPGQICTFLIIKGMSMTNNLMDTLISLDLSKVQKFFWHDIRGSSATDLNGKMQSLLTKMPKLECAEFYSAAFDAITMFPNYNCYWTHLGLEKVDENDLSFRKHRFIYRRIRKRKDIRSIRFRRISRNIFNAF